MMYIQRYWWRLALPSPKSSTVRVIGWLTNQLYKRMTNVIVLGRDMAATGAEKIECRGNTHSHHSKLGGCGFHSGHVNRRNHPLLEQLGLTDRFIVQYSGNIGRTHGIEQLVACAEQLKNNPAVHFLFIGFGGKKLLAYSACERNCGLSNITIMDYRPRTELPISLTACDVSIVPLIKGMAGVSVPSRLYNVMAAGKPIIAVADLDSELASVVREEDIGWVIPPGDIEGLRMAILEAQDQSGPVGANGSAGAPGSRN